MAAIPDILLKPVVYVVIGLLATTIVAVKIVFTGATEEFRRNTDPATPAWRAVVPWLFYRLVDMILVAVGLWIIYLIIAFPLTLAGLWPSVARAMVKPLWRSFALIFLFALSFAVYFLRQILLSFYAVVEILVGVAIAWGALGSPAQNGSLLQGIALAGSVYALVNGIDDFRKGQEESRKTIFQK